MHLPIDLLEGPGHDRQFLHLRLHQVPAGQRAGGIGGAFQQACQIGGESHLHHRDRTVLRPRQRLPQHRHPIGHLGIVAQGPRIQVLPVHFLVSQREELARLGCLALTHQSNGDRRAVVVGVQGAHIADGQGVVLGDGDGQQLHLVAAGQAVQHRHGQHIVTVIANVSVKNDRNGPILPLGTQARFLPQHLPARNQKPRQPPTRSPSTHRAFPRPAPDPFRKAPDYPKQTLCAAVFSAKNAASCPNCQPVSLAWSPGGTGSGQAFVGTVNWQV